VSWELDIFAACSKGCINTIKLGAHTPTYAVTLPSQHPLSTSFHQLTHTPTNAVTLPSHHLQSASFHQLKHTQQHGHIVTTWGSFFGRVTFALFLPNVRERDSCINRNKMEDAYAFFVVLLTPTSSKIRRTSGQMLFSFHYS
jgi:hypothetical protein